MSLVKQCDRSGDNRRMFEEIKEQKCTHAIIHYRVVITV